MPDQVEFVYFEGCPKAAAARENLRQALSAAGLESTWTEWDLLAGEIPDRVRRFASPTILIDGLDVTGSGAPSQSLACRSDPVPTVEMIQRALTR